ncbi:hypothetical protein GWI33_012915 [Rhynchophorus ferrugineus]|uniref:Uncharacterized protein n=1 Tax=Rhynchophorus ferrugineus TaxID=354439 RepID=A0A834I4F8_RHYFE|nr:hypothetical protein GWI33_012915 [Rhynchophorus ferrugineus]
MGLRKKSDRRNEGKRTKNNREERDIGRNTNAEITVVGDEPDGLLFCANIKSTYAFAIYRKTNAYRSRELFNFEFVGITDTKITSIFVQLPFDIRSNAENRRFNHVLEGFLYSSVDLMMN